MRRAPWQAALAHLARRIRAILDSDVTLIVALIVMALIVTWVSGLLTIRWLQAEGLWD